MNVGEGSYTYIHTYIHTCIHTTYIHTYIHVIVYLVSAVPLVDQSMQRGDEEMHAVPDMIIVCCIGRRYTIAYTMGTVTTRSGCQPVPLL
jgi:hypothetical protein